MQYVARRGGSAAGGQVACGIAKLHVALVLEKLLKRVVVDAFLLHVSWE